MIRCGVHNRAIVHKPHGRCRLATGSAQPIGHIHWQRGGGVGSGERWLEFRYDRRHLAQRRRVHTRPHASHGCGAARLASLLRRRANWRKFVVRQNLRYRRKDYRLAAPEQVRSMDCYVPRLMAKSKILLELLRCGRAHATMRPQHAAFQPQSTGYPNLDLEDDRLHAALLR